MLTARQKKAYDYLVEREMAGRTPPSIDEMREAMGVASKSNVVEVLNALQERGFIRRRKYMKRDIEVLRMHGANHVTSFPPEPMPYAARPLRHPGPEAEFFLAWKEPGQDMRLIPMEGRPQP